jgi:hypothetical protein
MILKDRVRDTEALLSVSEQLRLDTGIEQTETTIVLKSQIERPVALLASPASDRFTPPRTLSTHRTSAAGI